MGKLRLLGLGSAFKTLMNKSTESTEIYTTNEERNNGESKV